MSRPAPLFASPANLIWREWDAAVKFRRDQDSFVDHQIFGFTNRSNASCLSTDGVRPNWVLTRALMFFVARP